MGHIGSHLKSDYLNGSFLLYLQTIHTQYCYLHMDIKNPLVWLIHHYLYLFHVSFHYPENVGKYRTVFQSLLILWLCQSGENIRHYVRCRNPLILWRLMGVVMVPITDINCSAGIDEE